jgi:hypothetical protein
MEISKSNLVPRMPWNVMSVTESLTVMMEKERSVYKCSDYLKGTLGLRGVIDKEDRTKMVEWCYSVVDICQLEREAVAMAMEMVDRFLSKKSSRSVAMDVLRDRIQFQLLTMTALYISIKISTKIALGSDLFSMISRDLYPIKEIEAMEMILLQELSWCISAPTCVQTAHHILTLMSTHVTFDETTWATILNEIEYQAEYAVRDYYFVTQRPSTVALAAILNATDRFDKKHESQDAVCTVLSILKSAKFESIDVILATRNKLHTLIYGNEHSEDEDEGTDNDQ